MNATTVQIIRPGLGETRKLPLELELLEVVVVAASMA